MSRTNHRKDLNGSYNSGKSLNSHTSSLSKTIKKQIFVLPRKNISSSLIESNYESRIILPINFFNKPNNNLSQTPVRGGSILKCYGQILNINDGLRLSIKDKLLIFLKEKVRDCSTKKKKSEKVSFYKTHLKLKSPSKQRKICSNRRETTSKSQCQEECIMPLITQVQYKQREVKKFSDSNKREQRPSFRKTFCNKELPLKSPKAKSIQQYLVSPFLFKQTLYKDSFCVSKGRNVNAFMSEKPLKFESFYLPPNKQRPFDVTNKELKITPKRFHKTKRIVFNSRTDTEHLPLVVINFENILGVIKQKYWFNQGDIYYFIKPRILFKSISRIMLFLKTINEELSCCNTFFYFNKTI